MWTFEISTETELLMQSINKQLKPLYINDRIISGEQHFINSYRKIKDESWPSCDTYNDFDLLPQWIKKECATEHQFSPDLFKDSFKKDADLIFPEEIKSIKCSHEIVEMVTQNVDLIKDKKIIDFACRIGAYSFFAAKSGCQQILGVDVRNDNISIANSIKKTSNFKDGIDLDFQISDMHDYDQNRRLCQDKDVVFLFGILYHIHDHYDILRSICLPNIKTVMIETGIHKDTMPTIFWKIEPTFELISGWFNGLGKIAVGYPSIHYLDLIMQELGYKRTYLNPYTTYSSATCQSADFEAPRACLIYQR